MTVTEAVAAYKQYMMPFAHRAKLGAPVVSNGGNGMKWLEGFLNECTGCQIDFVPIHWYDKAINFDYFEGYVADAAKVAQGKPIWITEVCSSLYRLFVWLIRNRQIVQWSGHAR